MDILVVIDLTQTFETDIYIICNIYRLILLVQRNSMELPLSVG